MLAAGGQKGELAIWDTEEDKAIKQTFGPLLDPSARALKKNADKGLGKEEEAGEALEDDGDSGFEDVDSEEERRKKKKAKK